MRRADHRYLVRVIGITRRCITYLWLVCFSAGTQAQVFLLSENVYRLPYADGTLVEVTNDHWTHDPTGRIDMISVSGSLTIVAAADGIIEAIVDQHTESCFGDPCPCAADNNYVWLSHSNGEWTKYTHFQTGSVTDLGHQVGDFVTAGTALGLEGDVGCASGSHLHFEVAFPTTTQDPPFDPAGGFMLEGNAINRVPVICNISGFIFMENNFYACVPCGGCSSTSTYSISELESGEVAVRMASNAVSTSGNVVMESGSAALFRSGGNVVIQPGFHGQAGTRFTALIRPCNQNE